MTLNSVAVYCGDSSGNTNSFGESARTLGKLIAEQGIKLVYGGGHVSLMGEIADAIWGAVDVNLLFLAQPEMIAWFKARGFRRCAS